MVKISMYISAPGERTDEISPDPECSDSFGVPAQERGKQEMDRINCIKTGNQFWGHMQKLQT